MAKFNIMKWWKKKKSSKSLEQIPRNAPSAQQYGGLSPNSPSYIAKLYKNPEILERIFFYVCPHAQDETYETCEQSATGDTCMLCDLRDLAHCAQVSRQWRKLATNVL